MRLKKTFNMKQKQFSLTSLEIYSIKVRVSLPTAQSQTFCKVYWTLKDFFDSTMENIVLQLTNILAQYNFEAADSGQHFL